MQTLEISVLWKPEDVLEEALCPTAQLIPDSDPNKNPKIWNPDLLPPTRLMANILNFTKFLNKYAFWFELQHTCQDAPWKPTEQETESGSQQGYLRSSALRLWSHHCFQAWRSSPKLLVTLVQISLQRAVNSPEKIDFRHKGFHLGCPDLQKTRNPDSQIYRTKHVNSTVGMMFQNITSPQ